MRVLPGFAEPLGAVPMPDGTNFAVVSPGAEVTLCLFHEGLRDDAGAETRLVLPDRDGDVRHGFVPGVGPGQAYGYRVAGPFDPARGMRFDANKLLLDPYARAVRGEVTFAPQVVTGSPGDSAPFVPRSLVVAPGAAVTPRRPTPLSAVFLDGDTDPDIAADGTPLVDDDLLVLVNAWWEPLGFTVPVAGSWAVVCDTHTPSGSGPAAGTVSVGPRSLVVLRAAPSQDP